MLVGAPLVEAEQDRSVCIEDLCKVVMGRNGRRLTEQRLIPLEAAWHIGCPNDGPRALHWLPLCGPTLVQTGPATFGGRPNEVYKHFREKAAVSAAMTASATAPSQMATA